MGPRKCHVHRGAQPSGDVPPVLTGDSWLISLPVFSTSVRLERELPWRFDQPSSPTPGPCKGFSTNLRLSRPLIPLLLLPCLSQMLWLMTCGSNLESGGESDSIFGTILPVTLAIRQQVDKELLLTFRAVIF